MKLRCAIIGEVFQLKYICQQLHFEFLPACGVIVLCSECVLVYGYKFGKCPG